MPPPSLRGSVIQGSFPHGVPRHWNAGQAPPPFPPARGTVQPFQAQRPAPGPTPPPIQRIANGSAVQLPAGLALLRGTIGQKLPPAVQAKMESLFGASFEDVRVHVGPQAAKVGALAFTHGTDIYFSPHSYNPATRQGQQLLAHELTHVVQQRAGRARNPFGSGLAILQDHSLEAEADRMGRKAASAEVQPKIAPRPAVQPRSRSIQRMPHPGRRVLQMVFEDELRALSLLVKANELSVGAQQDQKSKVEEIQSMYLDGCVIVSANYPQDMQYLEKAVKKNNYTALRDQMWTEASKTQKVHRYSYFAFEQIDSDTQDTDADVAAMAEGLVNRTIRSGNSQFDNLSNVLIKSTPQGCAEAIQNNYLILLKGSSSEGYKLHAEQNLLHVLACYLHANPPPASLGIRGVKPACAACAAVLDAFDTAAHQVYGFRVTYRGGGQNRGGSGIAKLDLKAKFPNENLGTNFGRFVAIYDETLNLSHYNFDLGNQFRRTAAANYIRSLPQNKRQAAEQALLDAYNAPHAVSSIRVTIQGNQPVALTSQLGLEPDRNLSALLDALNVDHVRPQPVQQVNVQHQQNQLRHRDVPNNPRNNQQNQNPRPQNRNHQQRNNVQPPNNNQQQQQGLTYTQIGLRIGFGLTMVTGIGMSLYNYLYQSKEDPSRNRQPGRSHLLKPPSGGGRK